MVMNLLPESNVEMFSVFNFTRRRVTVLVCVFYKTLPITTPETNSRYTGFVDSQWRSGKIHRFKDYAYVGDPINAVKIFNEKEIDEIVVLDIDASREKRSPDIKKIREISSEAFIPLAYGGGISSVEQVKELFYTGVEKVVFNYQAIHKPPLITESAKLVGSQSVVVSIDVKKNWW